MDFLGYQIVQTDTKGRIIVATRPFEKDDIIFKEPPLVSCQFSWNKQYKYRSCGHCMRSLETAEENVKRLIPNESSIELPHIDCCPTQQHLFAHTKCENCDEEYCNDGCKEEALSKYHRVLCFGNLKEQLSCLDETWKRMHYPPETSTINLVVRILAMVMQNPEKVLPVLKDFQSIAENPDLMIFHKMLGENFTQQIDKLRTDVQKIFGSQEIVGEFLTETGFRSIFALIGTNSQGIGTSPFADWVKNVGDKSMSESERNSVDELIDTLYSVLEAENESFLNAEGAGLYSLQSKINHSCEPNAEIKFPHSNHVLAVTASNTIAVGEEISISYLGECDLERSRHSRQKILMENYLFVCECPLCCKQQADDPGVTSEEEMDTDDDEAESD